MVRGMQNYYRIATEINFDCHKLNRAVMTIITNRLSGISKKGRKLTKAEKERYGKSEPVGYVQHKIPMSKKFGVSYESDTREINIISQKIYKRNIEYMDNRTSLYFAQKGKCAVTGEKFTTAKEIHCHHKIPKSQGGTDEYENLILVTKIVHKLIHATTAVTVAKNLKICNPDMKKLNELRKLVGNIIL